MTPIQHSLYSHLPLEEGNHHHQVSLHPFLPAYETSSFPCAILLSPCQAGSTKHGQQQHNVLPQHEVKEHSSSGSSDHKSVPRAPVTAQDGEYSWHKNGAGEGDPSDSGSSRWMSSKMRFMRKMLGSDRMITPSKPRKSALGLQDQQGKIGDSNNIDNNNSSPNGTIRVCSDCNTTKTPLWRSGPRGPKSLCNACGIRQRKARRAMAAAAALTGGVIPAAVAPAKVRKEKRSAGGDCTVPFKKRFKFTAAAQTRKKFHFDEYAIGLSKNSRFHRVFPQDEKEEAAILLMALSCGLIRG